MDGTFVFLEGSFLDNVQLDIVGFLAILGEGSILANAQVATLSRMQYIPRLLPAPQALLRPTRPSKLESNPGRVTAVYSGNHVERVGHIGHVVIDAEDMPEYTVRCVQIRRANKNLVKARTVGPLSVVILLGCAEAIVLIVLAIYHRDGFGFVSIMLLAFLSTLIGVGNKWELKLPARKDPSEHTPPGNVVIRYPKGSFLVVECDEDVARELYFAPENIEYLVTHPWKYRIMSLIGTLMLMMGVVCLANADIYQQIAFGSAYIVLNAAYWIVAALPAKVHWDLTCFEVSDQRFENSQNNKHFVDHNETFTCALWKAIVATKSIDWVRLDNAAPQTTAWDDWLHEAQKKANDSRYHWDENKTKVWELPDWDPQAAIRDMMQLHKKPEKGENLA
ncbi:hypothetical protein P152DRAFT_471822 [Eremomyces bilateralis CBS 781.70]|uniref:Uncharacterized protein n=1 Tax=Eremomyces bilateralis CBS 781.70 TaxID=1392243 RepID=A0A6G1GBC3_9PEZI|nr:uncharacterized protein P152DRAFT_471822 [Eremomyces bilateralis CBS 781.70]KAF1815201.1 hypothetical protein P152DRAFT_471822 [Eremomyces bilateralis CBS 781.70]